MLLIIASNDLVDMRHLHLNFPVAVVLSIQEPFLSAVLKRTRPKEKHVVGGVKQFVDFLPDKLSREEESQAFLCDPADRWTRAEKPRFMK
jgi:hypothetical protein